MPPRVKQRCRFCPESDVQATLKPTPSPVATLAITMPGEGERLWKHVLFGTSTCVQMIEGYSALGLLGNPKDALVALRDRIQKVISEYEEEAHETSESRDPAEPVSSVDPP